MTLADLGPYESSGPASEDFGRTPPQDLPAEMSVLGGMMLSKDAIADVIEQIRGSDFYRPAHEMVYEAIMDLYGRGEPADAITVAATLTKRGEITRVGGQAYLHTLISSVPTAANAGYYARIVRERAVLRKLVEAGTKIVQLGYAAEGGDVDALVNTAQAEVYAVTERGTTEDYVPVGSVIEATVDEIEAASHRGEGMVGVPTGFADLDGLTNGLHPGQMIVIAARPAIGKALALDTPLATPSGWTTMGDVRVGHRVLSTDGTPTEVVAATGVMVGRPCYEVVFDDGSVVVADAEHLWVTRTEAERRTGAAGTRTTRELAQSLPDAPGGGCAGRGGHSIVTAAALDLPVAALPRGPYALGVEIGLLAGGDEASEVDPEVTMRLEAEAEAEAEAGAKVEAAAAADTGGDRAGDEHAERTRAENIPAAHLRASAPQRRDLLAGLLDAAGTVDPDGRVRVVLAGEQLSREVAELVVGLGHRCSVSAQGPAATPARYAVSFATDDDVFRLERKRLLHKQLRALGPAPVRERFVVAVRPVASRPVRCIQVDHASRTYLAGAAMVPTHNSTIGLDIVRSASIKHGLTSVVFSLEMSKTEITMRLLSAEAKIPLQNMRKGTMRDEDWTKMARTMGQLSEAPLFIDDSPNMTLMEIRAKCRRLKQRHGLKLVVIDYLQLMTSGKRVESRQQEVSEFSRALKLLAKELEVPVIAISQLNRGPEQRTDKRPAMSDLRESGSIEQDADMVILLHREDAYERESPRAGEADLIVAKHRNGPTDTIVVAFQGHYSRFVDMAAG